MLRVPMEELLGFQRLEFREKVEHQSYTQMIVILHSNPTI
jgi:hypothetical protein